MEFKKGGKVYFLPTDARELQEATIAKIGRKYIHISSKGRWYQINKDTLLVTDYFGNKVPIYATEQEYYNIREAESLVLALRKRFDYFGAHKAIPLNVLRKIAELLDE